MTDEDLPPMSMKDAWCYLWQRRTTVLGYLITVAGLATAGHLIPHPYADWLSILTGSAVSALGHYNNAKIKRQEQSVPFVQPENPK